MKFLNPCYLLTAYCKNCHFKKLELRFGDTYVNKEVDNYFSMPALNTKTNTINSLNRYDAKNLIINSPIKFYDEKDMYKGDISTSELYESHNFKLKKTENYCPNCKQFTLEFKDYVIYD